MRLQFLKDYLILNNMKMKLTKNSRGFTLVETLVAIGILSASIAATFTSVQMSLKISNNVKNQVTAFYLAQEALEFIKNVRDENALHSLENPGSVNWLHGLAENSNDPCWYGGGGVSQKTCTIDSAKGISGGGVSACSGGFGSCPNLNQDSSTGLFGYTSGGTWVPTNFKREIQITYAGADGIIVTIRMQWYSGSTPKSFTVSGSVYNR